MTVAALIVAAGKGLRAGGGLPKQYRTLGDMTVLRRSVLAFLNHPDIGMVRVVIHPDYRNAYDDAMHGLDLLDPANGGDSRQESVCNGLESLADLKPDHVLIHDGARPLVSPETISKVIAALGESDGAIAAQKVSDTIKRQANDGAPVILETVPREGLWRAQTPQAFHFNAILDAHRAARGRQLTDDAAVAEAAGLRVALIEGCKDNLKLTTADDFQVAERLMALMEDRNYLRETRTGIGFDVHKFEPEPGEHVIIGGLTIPHDHGLAGHSDADVALHAITDAVFGALCDGDIGSHFPPSDPQWKGAASDKFLDYAVRRVTGRAGRVLHVDLTIICERPKIGPHREAMTTRIAEIMGISKSRISVKATTTEKLGFTGRQEGIAAQAAVTLDLPAADD